MAGVRGLEPPDVISTIFVVAARGRSRRARLHRISRVKKFCVQELWSAIVPGPRWSGSTRRHRLNNASPAPERRHIARPPANGARDGRQDRYGRDRRLGPRAQIG
jgi:hypothetical protein